MAQSLGSTPTAPVLLPYTVSRPNLVFLPILTATEPTLLVAYFCRAMCVTERLGSVAAPAMEPYSRLTRMGQDLRPCTASVRHLFLLPTPTLTELIRVPP